MIFFLANNSTRQISAWLLMVNIIVVHQENMWDASVCSQQLKLTIHGLISDAEMLGRMIERLEKLLNFVPVQRALSLSANHIDQDEILRLVELRVVRECNLPDNYTNFLRVKQKEIKATATIHKNGPFFLFLRKCVASRWSNWASTKLRAFK